MSGIRALEKLRGLRDEAASKMVDNPRWVCMRAEEIADEIEAEITERFCEIPCDASGELCKCGDEIHLTDEDERLMVCGYTVGKDGFVSLYCSKLKDGRRWFPTVMTYASEVEHVKPRTVDDVLREFAERYLDYEGMPSAGRRGVSEALMDEYAAELRELLGGAE